MRNPCALAVFLWAVTTVACREEAAATDAGPPARTARPNPAEKKECRSPCSIAGRCGVNAEGACYARHDSDCLQADVCITSGQCSAVEGRCVGTSEDACRRSEQCAEAGRCQFVGQVIQPCVATAADCAKTARCKREGECSVEDGVCRVVSAADCAGSEACSADGRCSVFEHDELGRKNRTCQALSDDDCKRGAVCTVGKACAAKQGTCQ